MFAGELLTNTLDLMKTMGWKHKTDILGKKNFQVANELIHSTDKKQSIPIS